MVKLVGMRPLELIYRAADLNFRAVLFGCGGQQRQYCIVVQASWPLSRCEARTGATIAHWLFFAYANGVLGCAMKMTSLYATPNVMAEALMS